MKDEALKLAHCEAGPEFCPVCWAETRSLALAAAVGYIQRNTPRLVWTEICNALTTTPPAAAQPAHEKGQCLCKDKCLHMGMSLCKGLPSPLAAQPAQPAKTSAERTLQHLGYTNNGGEFWKPPLGTPPAAQRKPLTSEQQKAIAETAKNGHASTHDAIIWAIEYTECHHGITEKGQP